MKVQAHLYGMVNHVIRRRMLEEDLIMPQFTLSITLGNDSMCTPADIKKALDNLSRSIRYDDTLEDLTGRIKDTNGNTCGKYEVVL